MGIDGRDHIGVGVGAIAFDNQGRAFLAQRGSGARSEAGTWDFPGGGVHFGERLEDAIRREFLEEHGMLIRITGLLGVFDHILTEERQHWVSATYLARHTGGTSTIREPDKCLEIGWFDPDQPPGPLSQVAAANLRVLRDRR